MRGAHDYSKSETQFAGRNLLWFSSPVSSPSPDVDECNMRLTCVLKAFGFGQLSMPENGDCYSKTFPSEIVSHLIFIGLCKDIPNKDRVIVLRRLIVEELIGANRNLYEPFLVTSTDLYDTKKAQKFGEPGHYDSELGNCLPGWR